MAGPDDLAYFAGGKVLLIADVSDPESPRLISGLPLSIPSDAYVEDLFLAGGNVYLACGEQGLRIVDVRTPTAPVEVGSFKIGGASADAVVVSGNHAYLAYGEEHLRVLDVSDPSSPVDLGSFDQYHPCSPDDYRDIDASGDQVYVITECGEFAAFDVSTPSMPVPLATTLGDWLPGMDVSGGYAFVIGDYRRRLDVIDLHPPTAPTIVGSYAFGEGLLVNVTVEEEMAYLVGTGFEIVDVSTPEMPIRVGSIDQVGASSATLIDDIVYLGDGGGLGLIDIEIPSTPEMIGSFLFPPVSTDIAMFGQHAYAVTVNQLTVFDARAPVPLAIGSLELPVQYSPRVSISQSGGTAYVAGHEGELVVIDVAAPSAPLEIASLELGSGTGALAATEDHVYAAGLEVGSGLRVVDVSTPAAPIEVAYLELCEPQECALHDIAAAEDFVCVVGRVPAHDGNGFLWFIDASSPTDPIEVGSVETSGDAPGVFVSGNTVYVADGYSGLRVVDATEPSDPKEIGFAPMDGRAEDVVVLGDRAYVANGGPGLRVFDVSDPSEPVDIGLSYRPGHHRRISAADGRAVVLNTVVTQDWGGPSFFDLDACSGIPPTASFSFEPVFPTVGEPVRFFPSSTGSPTSWAWDFDDGESSDERSPTHEYHSSGLFTVSLTVSNDWGSDSSSATIFVDTAGAAFVPAVGIGPGAGDSFWSSDVVVNNRGAEQAACSFQFLAKGRDNTEPDSVGPFTLDPGLSVTYENVLGMFGVDAGSGALRITRDGPGDLIFMSRTKSTDSQGATFGQGIPALDSSALFQSGDRVRLIGLWETEGMRTNLGFLNGGSSPISLNIRFFDSDDTKLKSKQIELAPFSYEQLNSAFDAVNAGPVENGWVEVSLASDGRFFAYASVVDNLKNDPTFVLPQLPGTGGPGRVYIPAAGTGAGAGTSQWSTDVVVSWKSDDWIGIFDPLSATFLPRSEDNSTSPSVTLPRMEPAEDGRSLSIEDVLNDLFEVEEGSGALALDLRWSDPGFIFVSSRTKNTDAEGATFGQGIPAVHEDSLIQTGTRVRLIQLTDNSKLRTNLGFMNGSPSPLTVNVEFFGADGVSLGVDSLVLKPYSYEQWNRAFKRIVNGPVDNGFVDVWTTTPGGKFFSFASVVDMVKDDPTYVLPQ